MNEQPPATPLKLDLRVSLEALVDGLGILMAGVAVLNLSMPEAALIPLGIAAVLAVINRLLGRSSAAAIAELTTQVKSLIVQNAVFRQDAKPAVTRQAEAASEAIKPNP